MAFDNIYACDFETTVFEGQEFTEVWLAGICSLDGSRKCVVQSIDSFFNLIFSLPSRSVLYFHNLKFDGSFIIDWLERMNFIKALFKISGSFGNDGYRFKKSGDLLSKEYTTYISSRGTWYEICIKKGRNVYFIRDSYKLLPFPLSKITEDFDVEHKKLTMEYTGYRESNGIVKSEEMEYFEHDLLGLAECLKIMFDRGFTYPTIGSCCFHYFLELYGKYAFGKDFPNVYDIALPQDYFSYEGWKSVGDYIMKSYWGGFVLVDPEYQEKVVKGGKTIDATSLYASVMHSKSGVRWPMGMPIWGKGYYKDAKNYPGKYIFQRFTCQFRIKHGKLPFIKIKNTYLYDSTKCQTTSDLHWQNYTIENRVELTLSMSELNLFMDHYEVYDIEWLDYVMFHTCYGIFDRYIDHWLNLKNHSKNKVERTIAKSMLVNLYGKFCTKPDSSFKIPYMDEEEDKIFFKEQIARDTYPGYIPMGSAIVCEARIWHIRNCQKLKDEGRFIYSDTDSIHFLGDIPDTIPISENELGTYKLEAEWDRGWFQHPKRYIEEVKDDQGIYHFSVTCAGLPDRGKNLLRCSLGDYDVKKLGKLTDIEKEFVSKKRKLEDFTRGICIPGKLKLKRMKGGVVLRETTFTIL